MQQFVFVSHSSKDKIDRSAALKQLLDALTDANIKVWFDKPGALGYSPEDVERRFFRLVPGTDYEDEIDTARASAGVVLGVWSAHVIEAFKPESLGSEAGRILRNELDGARKANKLVSCRIDDASPTTYPNDYHRQQVADLRPESSAYTTERADLVQALKVKLRAPFFQEYRENRIQEWERPRYGAGDRLFTELALLLDRGADRDERWDQQKEHYGSLKAVLDEPKNQSHPAFVLLGDPGSGKSTLLRHFDLEVARRARASAPSETAPFSYFVSLRDYRNADGGTPDAPMKWLSERWDREWRKENRHVQSLEDLLQQKDSYLLLDALNEMPRGANKGDKNYDQMVLDWKAFIADVRARKWGCRIIFSCRSHLYSGILSAAGDEMVPHINILSLDPPTIRQFLDHYAGDNGASLFARIEDQLSLYNTAYFLRMLVAVADRTGQAPSDRAALFTAYIRMLLGREFKNNNAAVIMPGALSADDVSRLGGLAHSDSGWKTPYELLERSPLFKQLERLAFSMQAKGSSIQTGERLQLILDYDDALRELASVGGDEQQAKALVRAACDLSILEHDLNQDTVEFTHQLIQEYFAGRVLATSMDVQRMRVGWLSADVGERLPPNISDALPPADSSGWEEASLFAALMAKDRETFVKSLMETNLPLAGRAAAQVRASEQQSRTDSAARSGRAELSDGMIGTLRTRLLDRMTDRRGALRARIAAGKALGELGDARFTEGRSKAGRPFLTPPLLKLKRGDYLIGQPDSPHTYERARSRVALKSFSIAQFPVTNAEWRLFMQAGGYDDESWWRTEGAKLWRSGETTHAARTVQWYAFRFMLRENDYIDRKRANKDISEKIAEDHYKAHDKSDEDFAATMKADYDGAPHKEPRRWRDSAFNNPLQPVVGICWYEANAYCAWLSAQTGETWRLPTEAEWEAAARLGAAKDDIYPWGRAFDSSRCNTFRSHVRATTPVGLYLGQQSESSLGGLFRTKPDIELADMSGNAFEWTSSRYDKTHYAYPYKAADGRENLEDQPGRSDAASASMVNDLRNRATAENWSAEKLAQAIDVSRYFPRVLRGGSFYYWPDEARMSFRLRLHPGYHNQSTGFRLVRED